MSGITRITNGMIAPTEGDITIQKIIYPLDINLTNKKPSLTLDMSKKTISISVRRRTA